LKCSENPQISIICFYVAALFRVRKSLLYPKNQECDYAGCLPQTDPPQKAGQAPLAESLQLPDDLAAMLLGGKTSPIPGAHLIKMY
jgi:hypothetical protein